MPNGNELSEELEFEQQIKTFTLEGQFLARQLYKNCEQLEGLESRLADIEGVNKKVAGVFHATC